MKNALLSTLFLGFAGLGLVNFLALNAEAAAPNAISDEPVTNTDVSLPKQSEEVCLSSALVEKIAPTQLALAEREAKLDARTAELQALENILQDRLASLEATQKTLQSMSDELDASAKEDITHLVKMYSSMKPKKAASIFDKMDPAFAAGFIREIEGARAGLILSEMNVQQSYRVSLLIANRKASWRNGAQ